VVPKENGYDVFVDDDLKIRSDRVLVRNILTQCRVNPLLVKQHSWVSYILDDDLLRFGKMGDKKLIVFQSPKSLKSESYVDVQNSGRGLRSSAKDRGSVKNDLRSSAKDRGSENDDDVAKPVSTDAINKMKMKTPRQTVGSSPNVQSRSDLNDHVDKQNSNMLFTKGQAKTAIRKGRKEKMLLVFNQNNSKKGKSYWRYNFYKKAISFEDLDELCKTKSVYTDPLKREDDIAVAHAMKSDLIFHCARGLLHFIPTDFTPTDQP